MSKNNLFKKGGGFLSGGNTTETVLGYSHPRTINRRTRLDQLKGEEESNASTREGDKSDLSIEGGYKNDVSTEEGDSKPIPESVD